VASRRLRAALPLFQTCLPEKKYASWSNKSVLVTQALGEARDTDVQLEALENFYRALPEARYRSGINRLMLRLRQKRQKLNATSHPGNGRTDQRGRAWANARAPGAA
jgi:CHAD domain-containing protein